MTWKVSEKRQPERTKFRVPPVDAPNVNGAIDLGLLAKMAPGTLSPPPAPNLAELKTSIDSGRVKALYVFDPGPPGSLGDVSWIIAERESGRLPLLIVRPPDGVTKH